MTSTPPDACRHGLVRQLGVISKIPPPWLLHAELPLHESELESGWCPECQRYVWREVGSTPWTALTPPAAMRATACEHEHVQITATTRTRDGSAAPYAGSGEDRVDEIGLCRRCGIRIKRFRSFAQWSPWSSDR